MSSPVSQPIRSIWQRLPAIVRAILLAWAILIVGQLFPGLFLYAGLKLTPSFPWFVLATPIWLWILWSYLNGRWWPATTAVARARDLRAPALPATVWVWSLLAGGLALAAVLCGALLTGLIADLPSKAYEAPLKLGSYPWWTQLAFFLSVAATAGVVEEAAFRGYMLSIIEARHGWVAGIMIVALLFYAAHLSHTYATIAFLPFFMAYSLVLGILVYLTRSIVPGVVLHSIGDFVILPIQYGVAANPLGSSVGLHALAISAFSAAAGLAFWRLATICARA